ncbi:flagellar basal body rod protein FlgB [Pueribacillus theae]|uniref:Flagellar basal body rod protein FlgB n=1 Tax=Pueribacillus theae TaxID=2171751 RepID=A0A2U1K8K3_9BACI|nr:flagellar basal body rod protein FlgB [Pueribacillus theae]PWA13498.1 flagellar basal body rod protein FlgB [Pueribacillus theae]
MDLFSDSTLSALERRLHASSVRQNVISQNIANADTPHYKAKEVIFKDELSKAIGLQAKRTDNRHFNFAATQQNSGYTVATKNKSIMNNNGNNVDIDREMSLLAENQIYYNALIERINGKFSSLKNVAKGGK